MVSQIVFLCMDIGVQARVYGQQLPPQKKSIDFSGKIQIFRE